MWPCTTLDVCAVPVSTVVRVRVFSFMRLQNSNFLYDMCAFNKACHQHECGISKDEIILCQDCQDFLHAIFSAPQNQMGEVFFSNVCVRFLLLTVICVPSKHMS